MPMYNILFELKKYIDDGHIDKDKLLNKLEASYLLMEANNYDEVQKFFNKDMTGVDNYFWAELKKNRAITVVAYIPIADVGKPLMCNITFIDLTCINGIFYCKSIDYNFPTGNILVG
ncbi:MAG: hypothetical protein GF317_04575 [Candidatus Lokiarchaeota archaeon]|nr:hypothetical protein [Candidatus Lokiarchaeota archaeon]